VSVSFETGKDTTEVMMILDIISLKENLFGSQEKKRIVMKTKGMPWQRFRLTPSRFYLNLKKLFINYSFSLWKV